MIQRDALKELSFSVYTLFPVTTASIHPPRPLSGHRVSPLRSVQQVAEVFQGQVAALFKVAGCRLSSAGGAVRTTLHAHRTPAQELPLSQVWRKQQAGSLAQTGLTVHIPEQGKRRLEVTDKRRGQLLTTPQLWCER